MPPQTAGIPGTLFLYPHRVRIVTRDVTAVEHPRRPAVDSTSYRSQDRAPMIARRFGPGRTGAKRRRRAAKPANRITWKGGRIAGSTG